MMIIIFITIRMTISTVFFILKFTDYMIIIIVLRLLSRSRLREALSQVAGALLPPQIQVAGALLPPQIQVAGALLPPQIQVAGALLPPQIQVVGALLPPQQILSGNLAVK
jgi:hypothetical protein